MTDGVTTTRPTYNPTIFRMDNLWITANTSGFFYDSNCIEFQLLWPNTSTPLGEVVEFCSQFADR